MKNIFKVMLGATMLTTMTAMAAPQYPFPQNKKSPNGYTVPFATTDVIKEHFEIWKGAWYQDKGNEAWILSPEGTCSTVSEAIAYGMLIMVYMSDNQKDYKTEFDKLYATWKNYGGNGGGMDWRVGCSGGTGSATDSDIDAALALVMASKQWNNASYLSDAKTIINWIAQKDFNADNTLRPGSNWNDAFNPSYAGLANFRLFEKVSGDSKWSARRAQVAKDLLLCQNSSTGLVSDWCDWNSHQPTKTSASVAQSEAAGFFDDAARTPWRTAWAYYWYGDTDALAFNTKVAKWLIPTTKTAGGVNSGYYVDGRAETSAKRNFVSSTFSGGLGLATSSLDDDNSKAYMKSVYKSLANMVSCKTANGCGGSVPGEKYYPSTLNLLYLLLLSGNMPNLYDLAGFESFTPDPSLATAVDAVEGQQLQPRDSTKGLSGFWNWGAYHDKLGIGTKMVPDSGSSPLYIRNGEIIAEANMEIGPEPEWTQEAADAGTLKYPSAGIAMSFLSDDTKGVNFETLGVKKMRICVKVQGPIRMAILNEKTVEEGGEPGIFIPVSDDFQTLTYDLTPDDYGFKGTADEAITILSWVNTSDAPMGYEIITAVKGLKFEVKDAKGGSGSITVKSIEFLDAADQVIDPYLITGKKVASTVEGGTNYVYVSPVANLTKVSVEGQQIKIAAANNAEYAVFSMQGRVIASGKLSLGNASIMVPSKGAYMVRVGSKISKVNVK